MADLTNIMNPMAGLLSPDEQSAVQGNSLLQLAGGLLAGSGWQSHPVSLGSVFGQAALPALASQQQMTTNMLQAKHLKNQIDLEQMMMPFKQAAIQELMGAPQQAPVPTATDIQGNQFPVNQLPPYLSNNPNAAAQASQTIQNQQNSVPMQTAGVPGSGYFNPQEMYRRGQAYMMLGMPGGADLMNAALAHDPNLAAYTEAEKARATLPYNALNSFLRYAGRPTVANPGQQVYSGLQLLPPWAQNLISGAGRQAQPNQTQPVFQGPNGYPAPPSFGSPSPIASGIPLKTAEEQKSFGEANVKMVQDINAKAEQAISDRARNQQMLDILDKGGVSLGPLSGQVAYTKNLLTEILGPDKVPSKDPTNTQEFNKYAYQGAIQVAKQAFGGRISTKEVELTINSMPGNNITEKANRAMLYYSNLQLDRIIAQQTELNKWMDDPIKSKQLERFPSYFNKTFPLAGVRAPQTAVPNTATSGNVPVKSGGIKFLGFE